MKRIHFLLIALFTALSASMGAMENIEDMTELEESCSSSSPELLITAICTGQLDEVKRLRPQLPDINSTINGPTPLFLAIYHNQLEIATYLIAQGAILYKDLLEVAEKRNLPAMKQFLQERLKLSEACKTGDISYVKNYFSNNKTAIDTPINYGENALQIAAIFGQTKLAEELLELGANKDQKDIHDRTARQIIASDKLPFVAQSGNLEGVKYLVEELSVDVTVTDENDNSALHLATKHGHVDIVKYLIDKCAKDDLEEYLNEENGTGKTPLYYAIVDSNIELIDYLVSKGASLKNTSERAATPLLTMAIKGKLSKPSKKPLAAYTSRLKVVKHLVDTYKVDVNEVSSEDKQTPLHYAAYLGIIDIVKYLVSQGADVNAVKKSKDTALHYAAYANQLETIRYLVEEAEIANINAKNNNGQTALHLTSNLAVATYLVKNKADIRAKDIQGQSPLKIATKCGYKDIAQFLVQKGATISCKRKREE